MYNPYGGGLGNQRPNQGQYGSTNPSQDRDMRMGNMGLPYNTPGSSAPSNPLGMPGLPMFSQSMSYRPEPNRPMESHMDQSIDLQLSRAREEARLLGNPLSSNQGPSQMNRQRDDTYSPFSIPPSSSRQPSRPSETDSGITGSLSWLTNLTRPSTSDSLFSSVSPSSYGGESRRTRDDMTIPGLGDYPDSESKPPPQRQEPAKPKYNAESAANILRHFNLEKEDLEQLISYPENEITPDNLPLILRQIRLDKNRKTTATTSQSYSETLPRTASGIDSRGSSWASKDLKVPDYGQKDTFPKPGSALDYLKDRSPSLTKLSTSNRDYDDIPPIPSKLDLEKKAPPVVQQSKVIDYGHSTKYTGGSGDSMGTIARAIQGIMKIDTGFIREPLPPPSSSSAGKPISNLVTPSRDKISPGTSFTPMFQSSTLTSASPSSSKPPSNQPSKPPEKSFSMPKQDTDFRLRQPTAPKDEAKSKQTPKSQPPSAPVKTGVILVDSKKTTTQAPTTGKSQVRKPDESLFSKMPLLPTAAVSHVVPQKVMPRQVLMGAAAKTANPITSTIPTLSSNFTGRPMIVPPAPQQRPETHRNLPPATNKDSQFPIGFPLTKLLTFKGNPPKSLVLDYAAASPRTFPHSCCLCLKECTHMKVSGWLLSILSPVCQNKLNKCAFYLVFWEEL